MIHLSRYLIGIRHSRVFRMRSLSGQIIDDLVKEYPKDYTRVGESPGGDEVSLSDDDKRIVTIVNRDDILLDCKKVFDWANKKYIEVNKRKVLELAKGCVPIISDRFELEKDYSRIGMIFEFRIPEFDAIKGSSFGKFIFDNFLNFTPSEVGNEASLRFVDRLSVPGGTVLKKMNDYRNVIYIVNKSRGLDEEGIEKDCLFLSIDIQRIYEPMRKEIDIDEHYKFALDHLNKKVLPQFKAKGVDINL